MADPIPKAPRKSRSETTCRSRAVLSVLTGTTTERRERSETKWISRCLRV
jgi:hypothetical protein